MLKKQLIYGLLFIASFIKAQQIESHFTTLQQQVEATKSLELQLEKITNAIRNDATIVNDSVSFVWVNTYTKQALATQQYDDALLLTNAQLSYCIFTSLEHQEALAIAEHFYGFLNKCTEQHQIDVFYINYAEALTYNQRYQESIDILEKAVEHFETRKDSTISEFGYAYLKLGENSAKINGVSESVPYFDKAQKIFTYQKDTLLLLWTQNGLSTLFSFNNLYEEAEKARQPIYLLAPKIKASQVLAITYLRAAVDAFIQNNTKDELLYVEKALLNLNSNVDVSEIVKVLTYAFAIGTYARNQDMKHSDLYLAKIEKASSNYTHNPYLNTYYHLALAYNYYGHQQFEKAIEVTNTVTEEIEASKDIQNILRLELLKADIYQAMHEDKKALAHFKNYTTLKDSIAVTTSKKQFAYTQSIFEAEKKDLEIAKQQKNIQLLSTQNKIKTQWFILGGLILAAMAVIVILWRSRKFAVANEKLQKTYTSHLIKNIETERKRIASELHDSVGQKLLLLKREQNHTSEITQQVIDEIRTISQNLHPFQFEKLGLIKSVTHVIEQFQKNSKTFYSAEIDCEVLILDKNTELTLFRMLQESLQNVEKHAQAAACLVQIFEKNDTYHFIIKDNGIGFDTKLAHEKESLGMKTLHERATLIKADLKINSKLGNGTTITVTIKKHYA